jgi:hypothetical protein
VNVYVAVARNGGSLDDVQVFTDRDVAEARVAAWSYGMTEDEDGAWVDEAGDGDWLFDILMVDLLTAQDEANIILSELSHAGFLPDEWKERAQSVLEAVS